MNSSWDQLIRVAHRQHGHFTTRQAEDAGLFRSTLTYHLTQNRIERAAWGVYRLTSYQPGEDDRHAVLMLWSSDRDGNPQAVLSHETALLHYGLSDVFPEKIHLTVPSHFRKTAPADVILHKANLPRADVRQEQLLRITTPMRTLLDLAAAQIPTELLDSALSEGLDQGFVRKAEIRALAAESSGKDAAIAHPGRMRLLERVDSGNK